ncbi:MAG: MarR family transcriptional regulator [Bacteriovoracaceae bacterium]|nr:MarR family transcriptional regulator [Bacteriovoracaceae bacterium]
MSKTNAPLYKKKKKLNATLKETKVETWRSMLLTVELIYDHLEKKLLKLNCTYPRFRLLFALYFDGPLSAANLSERLRVSRGNMSTFIKRLEEDGLIMSCPLVSTKGRPKFILTQKGVDQTETLMSLHFENIQKLPLEADAHFLKQWKKIKEKIESHI